ncbi:MAG: hypothetical protein GF334_09030, partial [Candidatus Altiarchaeales archaeon]|nr:hypothetical protein [Candidatus Altiarchaeales archaeon]
MENLYREFHKLRGHPILRRRESLYSELSGKPHLTDEDLMRVFEYKGLGQTHNPYVQRYTQKAFNLESLEDKIQSLKRLSGVGIVTASAILMFQNPYKFAELNHLVWERLKKLYGFEGTPKDKKSDYGIG